MDKEGFKSSKSQISKANSRKISEKSGEFVNLKVNNSNNTNLTKHIHNLSDTVYTTQENRRPSSEDFLVESIRSVRESGTNGPRALISGVLTESPEVITKSRRKRKLGNPTYPSNRAVINDNVDQRKETYHVPLPSKEQYKATKQEWVRKYDLNDSKSVQLTKENKNQIDVKLSKGGMRENEGLSVMSETELVTDGLQVLLFDSLDNDQENVNLLSKLSRVMESTCMNPEDISRIGEWIIKKGNVAEQYNNRSKALLKTAKKILNENCHLRRNIHKLKKTADILQNKINTHPIKQEILEMRNEIQEYRSKLKNLSSSFTKIEGQIHNLWKDTSKEYQKGFKIAEDMSKFADQLRTENENMENFTEDFKNNASDVKDILLERMDSSQKSIQKLDKLKNIFRVALDENKKEISELNDEYVLQINICNIRKDIEELKQNLNTFRMKTKDLEGKSRTTMDKARILEQESVKLIHNFQFIYDNLPKQSKLDIQKDVITSTMQEMFNKLKNEKRNVERTGTEIKKLESEIQSKIKREKWKIVEKPQKLQNLQRDQDIWDTKMNRIFELFEQMETMKEDIRGEETENMQERKEFLKQFDYEEEQGLYTEDKLDIANRMICSEVTDLGVCTVSEFDSATKANLLRKVDLAEAKEFRQNTKNSLQVGFRDMKFIPESDENYLSGTYGKLATSEAFNIYC
ncbi:putative leucine-rich repeat-containing protein DDB_G0290503 [Centruroides vittatus]|uniref:putative leucine-rich repeat-containing protein DDB_G0290503 n=1 Tax=Centruroides vittatus TaxID=120091 RepID=UPI00350E9EBF